MLNNKFMHGFYLLMQWGKKEKCPRKKGLIDLGCLPFPMKSSGALTKLIYSSRKVKINLCFSIRCIMEKSKNSTYFITPMLID
jgi:hypothetical protein